ncbi:phosphotriesterase-related protein isoform X2 [Ostrinia nubilalis]|uniref:phosphotriesterase-related protein isoform X2 n=1 Tax=Ostrinia nubilalis TaxID=29057 RepID=UPI0030824773
MSPRVQTVLGDVKPEDLGVTLTHEHLAMDFTHFYRKPPKHLADRFNFGISLQTAGYLRQYPYSSKFNLVLNDQMSRDAVFNDVAYFKNYGGDFEIKAIKAAGTLQPHVGCGVSFHPHRVAEAPFEIVRLYLEAGGKADKLVMSHLDRTLLEQEKLLEFAELGVYCQFDLFGVEVSYYQLNVETDMPSDAQRIDLIKTLVDEGKEDRVLMSHDIHTKHRLVDFGGHGYSHIINNILPRMKTKGLSKATIDKITIENPARWLTIDKDY